MFYRERTFCTRILGCRCVVLAMSGVFCKLTACHDLSRTFLPRTSSASDRRWQQRFVSLHARSFHASVIAFVAHSVVALSRWWPTPLRLILPLYCRPQSLVTTLSLQSQRPDLACVIRFASFGIAARLRVASLIGGVSADLCPDRWGATVHLRS